MPTTACNPASGPWQQPKRARRRERHQSPLLLPLAGPLPIRQCSLSGGSSQQLQQAVDFRHQRLHLLHIVRLLRAPFFTVARVLSLLGLGRLRNLEAKPTLQRYEWEQPGDLIHVDVKSLSWFRQVGHRINSDRQQGGFLRGRLRQGPCRRRRCHPAGVRRGLDGCG